MFVGLFIYICLSSYFTVEVWATYQDLSFYLRSHHLFSKFDETIPRSSGLFIVHRKCIDFLDVVQKFYIGNNQQYNLVYTNDNVSEKCSNYFYYKPSMRIDPDIQLIENHLFISLIIPEYSRSIINDIRSQLEINIDNLIKCDDHSNIIIREDNYPQYTIIKDSIQTEINIRCNNLEICLKYLSNYQNIYYISSYKGQIIGSADMQSKVPQSNFQLPYTSEIQTNLGSFHATKYTQNEQGMDTIWSRLIHGEKIVLGIATHGLDKYHCFFYDKYSNVTYSPNITNYHRKIARYNDIIDRTDSIEGHGTLMTGLMVGEEDEVVGVTNGIAYKARVAIDDISRDKDKTMIIPEDLVQDLFLPSFQSGARIYALPFDGATDNTYSLYSLQIDKFMYETPGFLVVTASGNLGMKIGISTYGTCKNCLTVGSSYNYNMDLPCPKEQNMLYVCDYSGRGPTNDGRIKPDVVAIGNSIKSSFGEYNSTSPSCGLMTHYGTSYSCSLATGALALIKQYLADGFYPTGKRTVIDYMPNPPSSLLKAIIIHSGREMVGYIDGSDHQDTQYYDGRQGFGSIVLDQVLYFPESNFKLYLKNLDLSPKYNCHLYSLTVKNISRPFKVTVAWTDPPAAIISYNLLVHDINMNVIIDGHRYFPNGLNNSDNRNTVEMIYLHSVPSPNINVEVCCDNLQYIQKYSIVMTGDMDGSLGEPSYETHSKSGGLPGYVLAIVIVAVVIILLVIFGFVISWYLKHRRRQLIDNTNLVSVSDIMSH